MMRREIIHSAFSAENQIKTSLNTITGTCFMHLCRVKCAPRFVSEDDDAMRCHYVHTKLEVKINNNNDDDICCE